MKTAATSVLSLVVGAFLFAGSANALPESIVELYSDPGEFYLMGAQDAEIVDFGTAENVEICVNRDSQAVNAAGEAIGLEVDYRDKSKMIRPGNCMTVEAKNIVITPAESLPPGIVIRGTYRIR